MEKLTLTILFAFLSLAIVGALSSRGAAAATKTITVSAIQFIEAEAGKGVYKYYDSDAGVVCYRSSPYNNASISCVALNKN